MPIDIFEQSIDTVTPFELKPFYKFKSIIIINDNASKLKISTSKEMKKSARIPATSSFELTKDEFTELDIDSEKPLFFLGDTATITVGFIIFEFHKKKVLPKQTFEITEPIVVRKKRDATVVASMDSGRLVWEG